MTDEEDPGAEVIVLRPGADVEDDARPLATGERPGFCLHRLTRLEQEARRVYCRECGREVPAFDVLWDLAREWERYIEGRLMAKRRLASVEERLADLERAERNAKNRRRTWLRREPSEALRLLRRIADRYGHSSIGELVEARAYVEHLDAETPVMMEVERAREELIARLWQCPGAEAIIREILDG